MVIFVVIKSGNMTKLDFKHDLDYGERIWKLETKIEELQSEITHLEDNNLELENQIEELEREVERKEEYIEELHDILDENGIDEWESIDNVLVDSTKGN